MRDPKERRAYRKHERKDQIEREVAASMLMSQKPMSMRQIARRLDMRPSAHIMDILMEMATEGRLDYRVVNYRQGNFAQRFEFFIPAKRLATAIGAIYEEKSA